MMRCAVFGAGGGIGAALVEGLLARADVGTVYAGSRSDAGAGGERSTPFRFDLLNEASIIAAVAQMA